ncbi:NB-ARC domain-containing protein [Heracleum sosnowskyi]|uniref:NB-ARC domain-containing protein n=1 Tax=Heracleum sosnowskyi TaxID=360622 RepID=A0AAD8HGS8_9APIA|nr:NB-ARC domain-containing protein [Heracleum sosnowskyi]
MGEELETYILKKLDAAIAESASTKFNFTAKCLLPNLRQDFIELKALIVSKQNKIKAAAAAAAASSKKESTTAPAANVAKIPDASKPSAPAAAATDRDSSIPASTAVKEDSKVLLPPGGFKKSQVPRDAGDDKEIGASRGAGDKKDTDAPKDAGEDKKDKGASKDAGEDKKDKGAPKDAGDEKESAPAVGDLKETGAPLDAGDKENTDAVAGEKKALDTPSDDVAGDKKESSAPSDATSDEKETGAPLAEKELEALLARTSSKTTSSEESKASTPAKASVTSGGATDQHESDTHTPAAAGGDKESNVGTSAKTTSPDESEITPATDAVTGDKSIISPASAGDGEKESNASKTATLAKSSKEESEISPVTDEYDGATDHKSKTPPTSASGGKKESGVPPAAKSGTTDASTKSDSNAVVPDHNEENLLREQLYYLNNVLNEWQMIAKKPFSYSSDSYTSITDLSKTVKKIKQDLKEKPETTKKTEESGHSGTPPTASSDNASVIRTTPEVVEFRWSTRLVPKKVHGFEDKILSLERLLVLRRKDTDTFKAFGIHGMAGVGKTTLCQSIFSQTKVSDYFFPRIWVCLSKQKDEDEDNKKEVVKRMLRCLGIDDKIINKVDEKQGIRGLLFALRLQLTGKRYFIVLDDAHNTDEWFKMPDSDAENDNNKIYEKFSYGLPKECGGTVVVTSRVEQVVKNMVGVEENLRCIEPLTDEDTCWKIFKDTVEEDGTPFPKDLDKLKLEIVKRCDGLPLAAKLLGQIKHKELRENATPAGNQRAALEAGNHQAAGQAGNQQAAIQAG